MRVFNPPYPKFVSLMNVNEEVFLITLSLHFFVYKILIYIPACVAQWIGRVTPNVMSAGSIPIVSMHTPCQPLPY